MKPFVEELLKKFSLEKTYIAKSSISAGDKFHVVITRYDKPKKRLEFDFHDNIYNEAKLYDILMCLVIDMDLLKLSKDIDSFISLFEWPERDAAEDIYKKCMENTIKLKAFLTKKELDALLAETEDY